MYLKDDAAAPDISLDCVLTATRLIEENGSRSDEGRKHS